MSFIIKIPQNIYQERIKMPIIRFVSDTIDVFKQKTIKKANDIKDLFFRGGVLSLLTSSLVWLSVLMYVAFYYSYVPTVEHIRPVHVQFNTCEKHKGICSFPSAYVQLTKRHQLLMLGQSYHIQLELDMPESPANTELGMFMVCAQFRSRDRSLAQHVCRHTILQYRSPVLSAVRTFLMSPALLIGVMDQKQTLTIELFSDYEEDEQHPVTDIYIEIQSRYIELYSAKLLINAHFSGLRYLMFHWPILSGIVGITANLFFMILICLFSWYQLINCQEFNEYCRNKEIKQLSLKKELELKNDLDDSSSLEDASMLDDSPVEGSEAEHIVIRRSKSGTREYIDIIAPTDASDC